MNMDLKKIGRKLLFPPIWVSGVLLVISTAAIIAVFAKDINKTPIAYVSYVAAFYTLVVVCAFFGVVVPKRYKAVKEMIYDNPIGNRYMNDVEFKNRVSLYCSLGVNLLYVGTNVVSAFLYHSAWFGILAGYYMILAVMRFLLVWYSHKNKLGTKRLMELQCSRICAVILTTINLVMSGTVLMILYRHKGFQYPGMLIYVAAMYTFYVTSTAVRDLIKYRKFNNPILSTAKTVKMAAALVSMLSLETAMFSQFGDEMPLQSQRLMIALTGAGVSLIVIAMAVYRIAIATKEIREMRS